MRISTVPAFGAIVEHISDDEVRHAFFFMFLNAFKFLVIFSLLYTSVYYRAEDVNRILRRQ